MNKNKLVLCCFFLFIGCSFLNISFIKEPQVISPNIDSYIRPSSPTDITLSTDQGSPTVISTNVYYRTIQSNTYYITLNLDRNEVYFISLSAPFCEFYLYDDSSFTTELKFTDGGEIMFVPSSSKPYYLKWMMNNWNEGHFCVWRATKYNFEEIRTGINIVYDDADWAHTVIFFISPKVDLTWDERGIDVESPGFAAYHPINLNSGEAFNEKEFLGPFDLGINLINNPETGFILYFSKQGLFQITTPPEGLLIIIIVVVSIVGLVSLIYINKKYWKIGHRVKKRRREKQEARQTIKEQKMVELEIERRRTEQQSRDFSDAGKKIDSVVDDWQKGGRKEKKNKS